MGLQFYGTAGWKFCVRSQKQFFVRQVSVFFGHTFISLPHRSTVLMIAFQVSEAGRLGNAARPSTMGKALSQGLSIYIPFPRVLFKVFFQNSRYWNLFLEFKKINPEQNSRKRNFKKLRAKLEPKS